MVVGLVTARLQVGGAQTLKEKRAALREVTDRIAETMNISVAEVGASEALDTVELAFVTVAGDPGVVQARMAELSRRLQSGRRCVLVTLRTRIL